MKKKKISVIIILGMVLISTFLIGGFSLLYTLNTDQSTVKISVIWDEPENTGYAGYNISTTEPNHVEIYTLSERQRDSMHMVVWDFEINISLIKKDTGIYIGETDINLKLNLIYIVKVPQMINNINFIDNITAIEIDKTKKTNDITIHFWKNLMLVMKPAVYFYNTENISFRETLSISIPNGYATTTIPEIPLGKEITWENFEVYPESQILFNGEYYPYLFYEAIIEGLDILTFECGWVIQKTDNIWKVNGKMIGNLGNIEDLENFFKDSLLDLGLFENEIADFTEYWFEEKQIFAEEGTYILRQIPMNVINENFQLETNHSYSMNRLFFTFTYFPETKSIPNLLPLEPMTSNVDSDYILHEWGIIF